MSDDVAVGYIDENPFDDREDDIEDREDDERERGDEEQERDEDEDDEIDKKDPEIDEDDERERGDDEDHEDDEGDDEIDEAEIEVMQIQINDSDLANRVPDTQRQTYNLLTKFEKTRVISTRAEQIARGSAPTVQTDLTDPIAIAQEELLQNKIPIIIRRFVSEGNEKKYEEWNVKDLIKD